jgi:hypothetical protein
MQGGGVVREDFLDPAECRAVRPRSPNLGAMLFPTMSCPEPCTCKELMYRRALEHVGQILSLPAKRVGPLRPMFAIPVRLLMYTYNSCTLKYRRKART